MASECWRLGTNQAVGFSEDTDFLWMKCGDGLSRTACCRRLRTGHGLDQNWNCARSRTGLRHGQAAVTVSLRTGHGQGLTEFADIAWMPRGHAPVIAWLLSGNCTAIPGHLPGNSPDASLLLRQPLRGQSPALREMFPGNCSDTTRLSPSECPADSSDVARMFLRMLRGMLRGQGATRCLTFV